jgi:ATP-binding cassette subfamily C protein LapB
MHPHVRVEAIAFTLVGLAYPETEIAALSDVSFSIEPGEHVAILGRVGSGKSTLQKLAMGLYQPTAGAILVDGVDMRQLDPAEYRSQVGYVPQDVTLFYGTLRENIVLAHPLADDAAVLRAAELACLDGFINHHPKGFDLLVGERGDSLSGGQRKAVAIARAAIHEPPILLMDEPTGSMDHSTEAVVRSKLREFAVGKTLLVVTHTTSMLEIVDRILVMDNGKVVADGPRDEVMASLRSGAVARAS